MNQYAEKALEHLTGKNNLDFVSIEELEKVANAHPYFSVAQLLLAKKLKEIQAKGSPAQVQKTALYFTNPYWLHYQLMPSLPELQLTTKQETEDTPATEEIDEPESLERSNLEVTENGTIRLSSEELNAASLLAKQTLHEQEGNEETDKKQDVEETASISESKDEPVNTIADNEGIIAEEQIIPTEHSHQSVEEPTTTESTVADDRIKTDQEDETLALPEAKVPELIEETSSAEEPQNVFERATTQDTPKETEAPEFIGETSATETSENNIDNAVAENEQAEQSEDHSIITASDTFSIGQSENELLETPPTGLEETFADFQRPLIEQPIGVENFVQQPQDHHNINHLDNPLISVDAITQGVENENHPEVTVIKDDVEIHQTSDSAGEPGIENTSEVAPDPFHPEEEEVLEEIEQEKADKEEQEPVAEKLEEVLETHEITLPVNPKDEEIIDEFVEAQHHEHPTAEQVIETNKIPEVKPGKSEGAPVVNEPLIPIEPYYTIDYFASQGIRLTPEKDPQDKLGKQLKSFTQWLKHMKKLGPEDAVKSNEDNQVDSRIQRIADSSNTIKEVVTEAMAEVLEKQGKTEQAIEVYEKLSFLNPDKSTYFAGQIQKLKGL